MDSTAIIPNKPLLRPDEVANIFQVSQKTVYSWHAEGKLPGVKPGGRCLRFQRSVIVTIISKESTS